MSKKLQELYAWLDFYKQNHRHADIQKTKQQIREIESK